MLSLPEQPALVHGSGDVVGAQTLKLASQNNCPGCLTGRTSKPEHEELTRPPVPQLPRRPGTRFRTCTLIVTAGRWTLDAFSKRSSSDFTVFTFQRGASESCLPMVY